MDNWLTSKQAAEYSGFTVGTMSVWRSENYGPTYVRTPGGRIRYRATDIDNWMTSTI